MTGVQLGEDSGDLGAQHTQQGQLQERLTKQVADWLQTRLEPKGVGVVIQAEHTCMTLRGVQATGATTMTSTLLGLLRSDARSRSEFLALTGLPH
ncbi:hypothetical protein GCM10010271_69660 [Streptomyces kurssanovii]|nr:hypothetical protein GCM10010271_69660 [Streptomyces kurssanovii]